MSGENPAPIEPSSGQSLIVSQGSRGLMAPNSILKRTLCDVAKVAPSSLALVKRASVLIFAEKRHVGGILFEFLQMQGYGVRLAENCEDARRELLGQPCDLVVATTWSWRLPGLFEMIPRLKSTHPDAKILLLSGWEELPASIQEKVAPDSVMRVPMQLDDLLDRISSLLVQRHLPSLLRG